MKFIRRLAKKGFRLIICKLLIGTVMSSSWYFSLKVIYQAILTVIDWVKEIDITRGLPIPEKFLSYNGLSLIYVVICVLAVLFVTKVITKYGFLILKVLKAMAYH